MPKRKAPEATAAATASKKSKKEALAAAKAWHDKRLQSGPAGAKGAAAKVPASSAKASKKAAAKPVAVPGGGSVPAASRQKPDSVRSPLFEDEKAPKTNGGNTFLKSLREGKKPAAMGKKEAASSKSAPAAAAPSSSVTHGAKPDESISTTSKCPRIVEVVLIVILIFAFFALNTLFILQQVSVGESLEQHVLEVEKIKAELTKSRKVEEVLRSGVQVLEKTGMNTESIRDLATSPALYGIRSMEGDVSGEGSGDWQKGMQLLEEEKDSALRDFDAKLQESGNEQQRR